MRNKPTLSSLFLLIAAVLSITAMVSTSAAQSTSVSFVKTRGASLVDSNGQVIQLRGTNLGNWLVPEGYMISLSSASSPTRINELFVELVGPDSTAAFWDKYLDTYIQQQDIRYLKKIGSNHVRLPFHYLLFTDEEYLGQRNQGFTYLDRVVEWCRAEGLYVLLDMHCAPGGQTGDNIDDSVGYPYLYSSKTEQDKFVDIWTRIADRYKNDPVIVGYDLANEPIAHYFKDEQTELEASLNKLYGRTIASMRKVDPHHTIFLNASIWSTNFEMFRAPVAPNIVYEFHKYWMPPVDSAIAEYVHFRDSLQLPIYLGESGENTDSWVDSFRLVLDREDIGYAFWPYKKMRPGRCIRTIVQPESWSVITAYANSPRRTFKDIRAHRPKRALSQKALNDYLLHIRNIKTQLNQRYIEALGFTMKNDEP